MQYDVYNSGVIVYRNLFLKIVKPDNQNNVRVGYVRYNVYNDNNVIMVFACKEEDNPYVEYLKRKEL